MRTLAVVIERPGAASLSGLGLRAPGPSDVVVEIDWSGISTGTERLLWNGTMPSFPGMGYPLVPGYESVGRVVEAGSGSGRAVGETVFVPGADCFEGARGLFGGAASHLTVAGQRVVPIDPALGESGILLALAATAHHAIAGGSAPDLVVGHGVLGRLVARMCRALGAPAPVVWETDPARRDGTDDRVLSPEDDERRDYRTILDASGDASIVDDLVGRLAHGGEIVLAGFYPGTVGFAFAPAFMREARLRCSAEFRPNDLVAVRALIETGALDLRGLITHRRPAAQAETAYEVAFTDRSCLKMTLDWKDAA